MPVQLDAEDMRRFLANKIVMVTGAGPYYAPLPEFDFDEGRLILRPYSRDFPVQLLPLATHETPADYIVGRVCLVFSEL